MNRFCRTEQLLGADALRRLRAARVAVFGLGAVGSYAVEALARAGVGNLLLADCDVIKLSNFNRQLYALESTLSRPKTKVAAERVRDINPNCIVEARQVFIDATTAPLLLEPRPDAAVDAIDSVSPKVELICAAVKAGVPLVSSMGAATRTRPEDIRCGDISETDVCPLARFIRKRLRRRGIESGVRCIYSVEPPRTGAAPRDVEPDVFTRGRPRKPIGSLSYMTGIFGLLSACETLRMLVEMEPRA